MKYQHGPRYAHTQDSESEGEFPRKGTRQQKDGRLSAYFMRSLRPSIRHYRPEMLLADALKRELDVQVVRAKVG